MLSKSFSLFFFSSLLSRKMGENRNKRNGFRIQRANKLVRFVAFKFCEKTQKCIRPVTMETRCYPKKLQFQRCAKRFPYRSPWAQIFENKSFKLFKKPEKNHSWADLGPRSAWENFSQMLTRSGEIPSPRQTSIDTTNDCAMKSKRGALVRSSDPLSGHR